MSAAGGRRAGLLLAPFVLALGTTSGCGAHDEEAPGPSSAAPDRSAPGAPMIFVERTESAGLSSFQQVNGDPEKGWITGSIGGGVAFLDHDQDGDLDAYLTNGSRLEGSPAGEEPRDALYVQVERGRFVDQSAALGLGDPHWSAGVRVVDLVGDGWPDLFLTNNGPNAFYANTGGRFVESAADLGLDTGGWSAGAAFLDFDRDGDLDLYVANYVDVDMQELFAKKPVQSYRGVDVYFGPRGLPEAQDRFYLQGEDGSFRDATSEVEIEGTRAFGLGVVTFDVDEDGWMDVYVANDSTPNLLWRNLKGVRFEDISMFSGVALSLDGTPQAGMGIAVGDFDLDLRVDLYVTNFAEDYFTLYHGEGGGRFRDATARYDMRVATMPFLGWASGFEDFDRDGDLDLFAVNGHVFPQVDRFDLGTSYRQRNLLFENVEGRLVPVRGGGGPGFELAQASRGAAVGDYDGDGLLDLLIGNIDGPPALLQNQTDASGHWLGVRLRGSGKNRDAIGARVVARFRTADGRERALLRLAGTAAGFLSSSDPTLVFGLGELGDPVRIELEVTWPLGSVQRFPIEVVDRKVTIDAEHGLIEGD